MLTVAYHTSIGSSSTSSSSSIGVNDVNWSLQVYEDYADDPRNTDNAWLETIAINYHDEDGSLLRNATIKVSSASLI